MTARKFYLFALVLPLLLTIGSFVLQAAALASGLAAWGLNRAQLDVKRLILTAGFVYEADAPLLP